MPPQPMRVILEVKSFVHDFDSHMAERIGAGDCTAHFARDIRVINNKSLYLALKWCQKTTKSMGTFLRGFSVIVKRSNSMPLFG